MNNACKYINTQIISLSWSLLIGYYTVSFNLLMCKSGCFSFIFFLMTAMVMHLQHNSDRTRVQCISVCTLCTSDARLCTIDARLVGVLATNMEIEIW